MCTVLGVDNKRKGLKRITISILQTMKYLRLGAEHKQQLAAYRVTTLGKELQPLMEKTKAFLQNQKDR
jgi:hypothetical protein